jgi:hypothetical protein
MPCYRCGVRQTDPSRGQSPWKRGVRQYSQILICPGCQDAADWMADLDRCSQCSSVHLIKRLGEVECRDCGTIVPPSGEMGFPGLLDHEGTAPGAEGSGRGLAGSGASLGGSGVGLAGPGGDLAGAGRSPDLSEEVARALDRVLSRSLVSQSIQRGRDPEGKAAAGSHAGSASGSGAGAAGSGAAGSAAGRHRSARTAAGHHAAAHPGGSGDPGAPGAPGAERHRAARSGLAGAGAASLDEVRPGAFAG